MERKQTRRNVYQSLALNAEAVGEAGIQKAVVGERALGGEEAERHGNILAVALPLAAETAQPRLGSFQVRQQFQ